MQCKERKEQLLRCKNLNVSKKPPLFPQLYVQTGFSLTILGKLKKKKAAFYISLTFAVCPNFSQKCGSTRVTDDFHSCGGDSWVQNNIWQVLCRLEISLYICWSNRQQHNKICVVTLRLQRWQKADTNSWQLLWRRQLQTGGTGNFLHHFGRCLHLEALLCNSNSQGKAACGFNLYLGTQLHSDWVPPSSSPACLSFWNAHLPFGACLGSWKIIFF